MSGRKETFNERSGSAGAAPDDGKKRMKELFTIGHSTRSLHEFVALLDAYRIRMLVDVRTIPRSRHNPQFSAEVLERLLPAAGIEYLLFPGLGGLRHSQAGSPNAGWENASFRGFADYMQTQEFVNSLQRLCRLASVQPTAIMCAEAVPWRCHRSLIADALFVRHFQIRHIITATHSLVHSLTPFAKVEGAKVWYPGPAQGGKAPAKKTG